MKTLSIRLIIILFSIPIFTAATLTTLGQSCKSGQTRFSNRCEGTIDHNTAREEFTLLGIHRPPAIPSSTHSILQARFYFPPLGTEKATTTFLKAIEIQDTKHYSMDALQPLGSATGGLITFGPWPTSDVIDPEKIRHDNLAMLAGWQDSEEKIYVPVSFISPSTADQSPVYTFYLQTGYDLQSLNTSVVDRSNKEVFSKSEACNVSLYADCSLYNSGDSVAITLDFSAILDGYYYVVLSGIRPMNSRKVGDKFLIYHHK